MENWQKYRDKALNLIFAGSVSTKCSWTPQQIAVALRLVGPRDVLSKSKAKERVAAWARGEIRPMDVEAKGTVRVDFYDTREWKEVRYRALVQYGARCQCCGVGAAQGAVMHVDHIKPRSKHPELALTLSNLQVLCADCNIGKSNRDETDWRPKLVGVK